MRGGSGCRLGLGFCGRLFVTSLSVFSFIVDDEEEMLYGDSGFFFSFSKEEVRRSS